MGQIRQWVTNDAEKAKKLKQVLDSLDKSKNIDLITDDAIQCTVIHDDPKTMGSVDQVSIVMLGDVPSPSTPTT